MSLNYAFVEYAPDDAPQVGAVLVELASLWHMEWLSLVWENPDHPMHQQGIDAAPAALDRLNTKTMATLDPRRPGVRDWIKTFGPYSNDLSMMCGTAELDISDANTLSIGASREGLRAALLGPGLRALADRRRITVQVEWKRTVPLWRRFRPAPVLLVGECLMCGHDWREHDPADDVCSECLYEVEHDEVPAGFVPCRLVPHRR
ncbi:hypothetical protein [Isoptericola croceus]|uniref:hypothetical protein n=1 Tax=Isoptericola croceus TaxID=3031406 RepID=UPI0023F66515|nr:hypothetical protein [Isoptericola croceus]